MKLTPTGRLFLALAAAFYFAALTSQSSLLLLLSGVTLGCLIVNFFVARRAVKHLIIQAPTTTHLTEGEKISQPWLVTNPKKSAANFIQAESPAGILFRAAVIHGKAPANIVPDLIFKKRGIFTLSQFSLASLAPFGLIKSIRRIQLPGEVIVAPAIYHTRAPHAAGYDVMLGGKFKGQRPAASGTYFAGVRPFQDGDSLRQVHWKSSAKGQGLMVKTFEEELSGRVAFILDNGQPNAEKILDDAARAAGSAMFAALNEGHHVEAIDLARMELLLAPPFVDGAEILEFLARLPFVPTDSPNQIIPTLEQISKRSAISLVATAFTPAIADAIEHLQSHHRHVSLYLPAGSKRPSHLAGIPIFIYSEQEIIECP